MNKMLSSTCGSRSPILMFYSSFQQRYMLRLARAFSRRPVNIQSQFVRVEYHGTFSARLIRHNTSGLFGTPSINRQSRSSSLNCAARRWVRGLPAGAPRERLVPKSARIWPAAWPRRSGGMAIGLVMVRVLGPLAFEPADSSS